MQDAPKYESLLGIDKMRKNLENEKEKSPLKAALFCKLFGMLTGSGKFKFVGALT